MSSLNACKSCNSPRFTSSSAVWRRKLCVSKLDRYATARNANRLLRIQVCSALRPGMETAFAADVVIDQLDHAAQQNEAQPGDQKCRAARKQDAATIIASRYSEMK